MQITKQYFNEEVIRFRKMLGDRDFLFTLNGLERLQKAFAGLFMVYVRATATDIHPDSTPDDIEQMKATFEATHTDYKMRVNYVFGQPLTANL